ncbi:MAG TPA: DUF4382 domain-containing protein [Gemmatimonadales bacterium]|nr:DUF4382 domain-containing protein [Gemmatimonadales bacterium]
MRSTGMVIGLGALLALSACDSNEIGPQAPHTTDGKTSVFLTDDPFPFDGVSRVDIHVVSIALAVRADTSESGPPWVTVATPDRAFNLLDLQNGSTALLGDAVIPRGNYSAVRMVIDPDRSGITDAEGQTITRTETPGTPGIDWQAKGVHPTLYAMVEEPMAVDENGADIVIDFDVGRSFLYDGHGGFTFMPFLRAITRSGSGGITGLVRREDGTPAPNALLGVYYGLDSTSVLGPLASTSRSDAQGRFTISFFRPGSYQVMAEDVRRHLRSEVVTVQVRAGQTVDAGELRFRLTAGQSAAGQSAAAEAQ